MSSSKQTTLVLGSGLEDETIRVLGNGCDFLEQGPGNLAALLSRLAALPAGSQVVFTTRPNRALEPALGVQDKRVVHILDPYAYSDLSHRPPPAMLRMSTIERFAALMDKRLTPQQWQIAVAARDGYAGLAQLGLPLQAARDLRKSYFERLGLTKELDSARVQVEKQVRELDDLRIVAIGQDLSPAAVEAAQELDLGDAEDGDYERARRLRQAPCLKPVLIIGQTPSPAFAALTGVDSSRQQFEVNVRSEGITGLVLAAPSRHYDWLRRLLYDPALGGDFDMRLRTGHHLCQFQARVKCQHPGPATDSLVSRLLSVLLVTGRPLRYYTCTFFLPLDLLDLRSNGELEDEPSKLRKTLTLRPAVDEGPEAVPNGKIYIERHRVAGSKEALQHLPRWGPDRTLEDKEASEIEAEAQALLYFTPLIQDLVFDPNPGTAGASEPTTLVHRRIAPSCLKGAVLALEGLSEADQRLAAPATRIASVRDVSLFENYNGLFLLALRVELSQDAAELVRDSTLDREDDAWWHDLVFSEPDRFQRIRGLQAEAWLRFTYSARLLRASYPEQQKEDKINSLRLVLGNEPTTFTPAQPFSAIVERLLRQFFDCPQIGDRAFENHRDDRMFVNVAYGLAGSVPPSDHEASAAFRRLFSLALYLERGASGFDSEGGFPYDRRFTEDHLSQDAYTRWEGIGTLMGYTDYSNAYAGYGPFFRRVIAPVHVPHIYGRMLALALLYRATLQHFDRRITPATDELSREGHLAEAFQKLHKHFIEFTNKHWFRELTPQGQGVEIFAKQTAAMRLDAHYELVSDEMERADGYVNTLKNERSAKIQIAAGILALLFAVLVVDDVEKAGVVKESVRWIWNRFECPSEHVLRLKDIAPILKVGLMLLAASVVIPFLYASCGATVITFVLAAVGSMLMVSTGGNTSCTFSAGIVALLLVAILVIYARKRSRSNST